MWWIGEYALEYIQNKSNIIDIKVVVVEDKTTNTTQQVINENQKGGADSTTDLLKSITKSIFLRPSGQKFECTVIY